MYNPHLDQGSIRQINEDSRTSSDPDAFTWYSAARPRQPRFSFKREHPARKSQRNNTRQTRESSPTRATRCKPRVLKIPTDPDTSPPPRAALRVYTRAPSRDVPDYASQPPSIRTSRLLLCTIPIRARRTPRIRNKPLSAEKRLSPRGGISSCPRGPARARNEGKFPGDRITRGGGSSGRPLCAFARRDKTE